MSRRTRQQAPPPPKATRRVSDSVLARVLDNHMLESLSDIADTYQRLAASLGYKAMQWKEYIKTQKSMTNDEKWLDHASIIARWRQQCERRDLDTRTVMLVVADGAGLAQVMRTLKMSRQCVEKHLRACLTQWSFTRKKCNIEEFIRTIADVASCNCGRKRKKRRSQLKRAV